MCLILRAWQAHPDYPLVVAANRDEFFSRPTAPADFWPEAPDVLAGRDIEAGGTWLGITRQQRFAALTNYRDGQKPRPGTPSRGALVANFLQGDLDPVDYLDRASVQASRHNGFNLLVGDAHRLGYLSNRSPNETGIRWLTPGIYGLSNHLLDTPWPKLTSAKTAFARALLQLPDTAALFDLLGDDEIVPDDALPETGVALSWERVLSAIFVKSADYGTRASTVLACQHDGEITFIERGFGNNTEILGEVREQFQSSVISTGV